MAKEKKPSIYVDRGTIGSSDELDEYGVWVKSEPQDLSAKSIGTENIPDKDDTDFEIPNIDDMPDFDASEKSTTEDISMDDDFSLPVAEQNNEEDSSGNVFNFGDFTEQINLKDADEDLSALSEIEDITESEELSSEITLEEDTSDFDDVPMDEFIGPMDTDAEDSTEISSGITAGVVSTANVDSGKSTPASDLSTQLLMKIAEELSSIRTELSSLKKEFTGIKIAAKTVDVEEAGYFGEEDDEKISLTGDELNNILNTADFTEESGADATVELSGDLTLEEPQDIEVIQGIEDIQDIPDASEELTVESLSDEEFSSGDLSADDLSMDSIDNNSLDDLPQGSDSLELSIADLDQQNLAEAGLDSLDDLDVEIDLGKTNMDLSDAETVLGNSIEELGVSEEIAPDFSDLESEELSEIREKGAEPMASAPAPEDAEYLTSDPLAEDLLDTPIELEEIPLDDSTDLSGELDIDEFESDDFDSDNTIDLSGAVIDEPDLSSGIQDNPLVEPSLEDISINLDLSDLGAVDSESADLEPIEFDSTEPLSDESSLEEMELPPIDEVEEFTPEDIGVEPFDSEEISKDSFEETEELLTLSTPEPASPKDSDAQESSEAKSYIKLKQELKTVLTYMDQLLESLPDEKIEEFARSDYYDTYKKLFKELGLA